MKKNFLLFTLLLAATCELGAQSRDLILRKNENQFFLEHAVAKGENFYSIGRIYNVPARDIAAYNKLNMEKGLDIGQKIRIPLTETNFTQQANSGTPVYYRAGLNTTLTRISEAYRGVGVDRLRYWNRRQLEEVREGEKLIIGFMTGTSMPVVTIDYSPPTSTEPVVQREPEQVAPPVNNEPIVAKNEPEPPARPVISEKEESRKGEEQGMGYFSNAYERQGRIQPPANQLTVTSGIFKTTSGWEDEKYYALVDDVSPGTIIRLENPSNKKIIYAKVLGGMSGIRMNATYDIRLSNAAASRLEVGEMEKFILQMTY